METVFKLISSLEKIFFDIPDNIPVTDKGSMLKNEIYSFQLACKAFSENVFGNITCRVEIESNITDFISVYQIDYVPSRLPAYPRTADKNFITKLPGLFPDPMKKVRDGHFVIINDEACSLWFVVEPNGKTFGNYPIRIKIYSDENNELLTTQIFELKIIDKELPKQNLINTGWFHGDCISSIHNVKINTDEYFKIAEKYVEVYAKFGHNMILTPIFTPPLDTDIGGERPTNQLVDIFLHDGKYSFDFKKLDYWIDLCVKYGIEYFEMAHFFTQWGAEFTPKIMAETDDGYKRIFGWDVKAVSDEYKTFINAFLPELIDFLKKKGVYDNCVFHVSDEPSREKIDNYRAARDILLPYIPEDRLMDALSDYAFCESGLVKRPIPTNDHIKVFMEHGVKNLWTYYCCTQYDKVANRFMAMPSARNRILGYQLYKYDIKGFLQWGFNFWFTQRSRAVINPYAVTDAGCAFPSGDAFLVYPLDDCEEVVTSLRLYVFNEGLQDMRALELLEKLKGREAVESLLGDIQGFDTYPCDAEYILSLRERINHEIEKA